MTTTDPMVQQRPDWLKVRAQNGPNFKDLKGIMADLSLHTICEEAHCPNIMECWEYRTASFLILGDTCTRRCGYCAVNTGLPHGLDMGEPERLTQAVERMGLKHVVITSVTRDDLPDGGAMIFAACIRKLRQRVPDLGIEVLIPDFKGQEKPLAMVLKAGPNVLNHNIETVARLFPKVRSGGRYLRSLELLERARQMAPEIPTKSGMMVGLGETYEEILQVLADLRAVGVDLVTIGQYLRPKGQYEYAPIARYYRPDEFQRLKEEGLRLGFKHVESGSLVRSSYHAHQQVEAAQQAEAR